MSDTVFSQLPKFHPATDRQPADWLKILRTPGEAGERAEAARVPAAGAPAAPAALETAMAAPAPATHEVALEGAVKSLAGLLNRLEAEAREQAAVALRAMATELLPELSRQFLAEEIMRHVPALVPSSAARFEIRAEPEVAARLGDLIAQYPSLAERCEVVPQEGEGAGSAEISWRTGGVTFDFDSLMSACLARLSPSSTVIKE